MDLYFTIRPRTHSSAETVDEVYGRRINGVNREQRTAFRVVNFSKFRRSLGAKLRRRRTLFAVTQSIRSVLGRLETEVCALRRVGEHFRRFGGSRPRRGSKSV